MKASDVLRKVIASNAALRVIVFDCCDAARGLEQVLRKHIPAVEGQRTGTYAVASSARDVSALAPIEAAHTAFSGVLIDVLDNGLDNGHPYLDIDEVFRNVESVTEARGLPAVQILTALKGKPSRFSWNAYYPASTWRGGLFAEEMLGIYARIDEHLQALQSLRGVASQAQLGAVRDLIGEARALFDQLNIAVEAGISQWSESDLDDLSAAIADSADSVDRYLSASKQARRRRQRIETQNALAYSLRQSDDDTAVLIERRRALVNALNNLKGVIRAVSRASG